MGLPWDFHPIEGERVRLDMLRKDDYDALYELHSDPEVCRYLLFEPRTPSEVATVLERDAAKTRLAKIGDYVQPAIRHRDGDGALMGTMYFHISSVDDRTAEIGWLVGPR